MPQLEAYIQPVSSQQRIPLPNLTDVFIGRPDRLIVTDVNLAIRISKQQLKFNFNKSEGSVTVTRLGQSSSTLSAEPLPRNVPTVLRGPGTYPFTLHLDLFPAAVHISPIPSPPPSLPPQQAGDTVPVASLSLSFPPPSPPHISEPPDDRTTVAGSTASTSTPPTALRRTATGLTSVSTALSSAPLNHPQPSTSSFLHVNQPSSPQRPDFFADHSSIATSDDEQEKDSDGGRPGFHNPWGDDEGWWAPEDWNEGDEIEVESDYLQEDSISSDEDGDMSLETKSDLGTQMATKVVAEGKSRRRPASRANSNTTPSNGGKPATTTTTATRKRRKTTTRSHSLSSSGSSLSSTSPPTKKSRTRTSEAPQNPRRRPTPYELFSRASRARIRRENPGKGPQWVTAKVRGEWAALQEHGEGGRIEWEELARKGGWKGRALGGKRRQKKGGDREGEEQEEGDEDVDIDEVVASEAGADEVIDWTKGSGDEVEDEDEILVPKAQKSRGNARGRGRGGRTGTALVGKDKEGRGTMQTTAGVKMGGRVKTSVVLDSEDGDLEGGTSPGQSSATEEDGERTGGYTQTRTNMRGGRALQSEVEGVVAGDATSSSVLSASLAQLPLPARHPPLGPVAARSVVRGTAAVRRNVLDRLFSSSEGEEAREAEEPGADVNVRSSEMDGGADGVGSSSTVSSKPSQVLFTGTGSLQWEPEPSAICGSLLASDGSYVRARKDPFESDDSGESESAL
ncbi:hypothetical protein HDU93_009702 [Gonapodya sp. JEL0774]|nr:hypothetical protein HDU93_009702 [Gonapodya sp. JEL0774]